MASDLRCDQTPDYFCYDCARICTAVKEDRFFIFFIYFNCKLLHVFYVRSRKCWTPNYSETSTGAKSHMA